MTRNDLMLIIHYLSRVQVRGFEDEDTLVQLMKRVEGQLVRTNKSKNSYTDKSGTAA